jgi:hypothetical protein
MAKEGTVFGKSVGTKLKPDYEITDINLGYNFIFFQYLDAT